jgi:hypothetical protein
MSKKASKEEKVTRLVINKGTSQGRGNIKFASMNKAKKRSFKKYRGQGKPQ